MTKRIRLFQLGVQLGVILCVGLMVANAWVPARYLVWGWRWWSEWVGLIVGVVFVRMFGEWVSKGRLQLVVGDFLVMNMVLFVVCALGLLGISLWLGQEHISGVLEIQRMMLKAAPTGWWAVSGLALREAFRLLVVGSLPVIGYRIWRNVVVG